MILKLDMEYQREELYKVYINHDLGMTLTYFTARQYRWPMHLNGENCQNVILRGKTTRKWVNGLKIYDSKNLWTLGAGLPPPRGNIHVYYQNIQRPSSLKPLGQ